jgi:hypothetical protein
MATVAMLTMTAMSAATSIAGGVGAKKNAGLEADYLRGIGRVEAEDTRRAGAKLIGSQTVGFAGAGVDIGSGSPLDVLGDTVAEIELAALRAQFSRESQAGSLERRGQQALMMGVTSGIGTVLGGAAQLGRLGSKPTSDFGNAGSI